MVHMEGKVIMFHDGHSCSDNQEAGLSLRQLRSTTPQDAQHDIGVAWRHICDDSIVLPSDMLVMSQLGMSATERANAGPSNNHTTEETTLKEDILGEDTPEEDASEEDMPEESMLNAQLFGTEPPERGLSGTDLPPTGGKEGQLSSLQHLLSVEDDVLESTEQTAAGSSLQLHSKIGTI